MRVAFIYIDFNVNCKCAYSYFKRLWYAYVRELLSPALTRAERINTVKLNCAMEKLKSHKIDLKTIFQLKLCPFVEGNQWNKRQTR